MPEKKYYWLKLHKDFFKQKEIKRLRRIAGGDVYTIIYLKMLLHSLETDGFLYYDGYYDSFIDELAADIDEDEENVKVVVSFLLDKGLMEEKEEDAFLLTKCQEMTGSESGAASRMRRCRQRKSQALQCNDEPSQCYASPSQRYIDVTKRYTEKEIEKDIEKEKEIETKKDNSSKNKGVSEEQIEADFEELWRIYPNKKGRSGALTAYKRAIKAGTTKEEIKAGLEKYVEHIKRLGSESRYIKHGSTWFNQKCWDDEYESEVYENGGNIDPARQHWDDNDPTVI